MKKIIGLAFSWVIGPAISLSFAGLGVQDAIGQTPEFTKRVAPSAVREENKDYSWYVHKTKKNIPEKFRSSRMNALDVARPISELPIEKIPEWYDQNEIENSFLYLRDLQFLNDKDHNLLRRSSWLFPDDGCYARADLAKDNLEKSKHGPVSKIFVYGNLMVQTDNSLSGYVQWWYHVAIAVRHGKMVYIFDPAIEPKHPIELNEWLKTQTDEPNTLEVSVCDPDTYSPSDNCESAEPVGDQAVRDQNRFLSDEWERQRDLGRNPESVLGDNPPWKK